MTKKTESKINQQLEAALAAELQEVQRKNPDGTPAYALIDRMRAYDRALKMQSLKLKIPSAEWASEFKDG